RRLGTVICTGHVYDGRYDCDGEKSRHGLRAAVDPETTAADRRSRGRRARTRCGGTAPWQRRCRLHRWYAVAGRRVAAARTRIPRDPGAVDATLSSAPSRSRCGHGGPSISSNTATVAARRNLHALVRLAGA